MAFRSNLETGDDLGASFAVVHEGEMIVDLWGGTANRDTGQAWKRDTLQVVFSGTKGVVSTCLLLLRDRGELTFDAAVSSYWPEFAAAGKGKVTVREVVTHTARLPAIDQLLTTDDLLDDRRMAAELAAQPQSSDPRAHKVYHLLTFGWLCGELVRRIDGRSVGQFFAEEIAAPSGLDFYIGLPAELVGQVARIELHDSWDADGNRCRENSDGLFRSVWANPTIWTRECALWNDPRFYAAEIPAINGIGTSRAIARLYGALDRILSADSVRLARSELERRWEPLIGDEQVFRA